MPRTILPKGQPYFITRGCPLSESAKSKLLAYLGYNNQGRCVAAPASKADAATPRADIALIIGKIENALGIYVDGAQHIDNPPRPADYLREFGSIQEEAWKLSEKLFEINYYYSDELLSLGADCATIAADLCKLAEASRLAREKFQGRSSIGARKNTALLETIRHLKRIFRDTYCGPGGSRRKRGAFIQSAKWEGPQLGFVRTALLDAGCIKEAFNEEQLESQTKELERLIRDPRTSLPAERNIVIDRLAAKRGGRSTSPYTFPEPDPSRLARARRKKGSKR